MKIIFAGTPVFAEIALQALIDSSHEIVAVYTQPDRPQGRGLKMTASPVKMLALAKALPVYQPASLKNDEEQARLASFKADAMVVAAFGMLLPAKVLQLFPKGCINIHPSLLPRWRGAAPIQRTLFAGDTITGVTIMQMDEGLDTGPILLQREIKLEAFETAQTLHDKLAKLGPETLLETLDLLAQGKIKPKLQDNQLATYAHKIKKEEALIDWLRKAIDIEREIRAFNPWPVAYATWQGKPLRIWQARVLNEDHLATPGTILRVGRVGVDIATGSGVLRLLKIQLPGGKILSASDFYNARRNELIVGQQLV